MNLFKNFEKLFDIVISAACILFLIIVGYALLPFCFTILFYIAKISLLVIVIIFGAYIGLKLSKRWK
jgi:hypothetical protein